MKEFQLNLDINVCRWACVTASLGEILLEPLGWKRADGSKRFKLSRDIRHRPNNAHLLAVNVKNYWEGSWHWNWDGYWAVYEKISFLWQLCHRSFYYVYFKCICNNFTNINQCFQVCESAKTISRPWRVFAWVFREKIHIFPYSPLMCYFTLWPMRTSCFTLVTHGYKELKLFSIKSMQNYTV